MKNPFEILDTIPVPKDHVPREQTGREGKKRLDILVRKIIEANPEIEERVREGIKFLKEQNVPIPIVHFTTGNIITDKGRRVPSGMTEKIETEGFRRRHTNVGVWVARGKKSRLADPADYEECPKEFIKSLTLLLERYAHHGTRTNKDALGEQKNKGEGAPVMILIEGGKNLERGTDYDDHFLLTKNISPDAIVGKIDMEDWNKEKEESIARITKEVFDLIKKHYEKKENVEMELE